MIKIKWHWIDYIFITIILALVVRSFFVQSYKVESDSMVPTLYENDLILCYSKIKVNKFSIKRNDIIVFRSPVFPHEEYVKRVIGLPGERVSVLSNCAYVNGQYIEANYIKSSNGLYYNMSNVTVPSNSFFVLGDNREHSSDSRSWGFVPFSMVNGKCILIYWPLHHFKFLF